MKTQKHISIKSESELAILRDAGKILADIIAELRRSLTSGITTREVNTRAEAVIASRKVVPAFKGYRGFPGCICISVNEEVVHGIPSDRVLKDGDIVSLDVGIVYKGFYSDTAITAGIGSVRRELSELMNVTREALHRGIESARAEACVSDISYAIQTHVERAGYSVVRDFVGHGIGRYLHEDPEIPNYGSPSNGPIIKEGMVFAIEPMVNAGTWKTEVLADGWTVVTRDRKPSAHFEHSVAITRNGPEILTQ